MAADLNSFRDEAATVMGQYLLRGYKMLANNCADCGTVLIQKKGQKELCVLCHEILPKVSAETSNSENLVTTIKPDTGCHDNAGIMEAPTSSGRIEIPEILDQEFVSQQLRVTRRALLSQIIKATREFDALENSSIVTKTQICTMITTAATSLKTLKDCENAIN